MARLLTLLLVAALGALPAHAADNTNQTAAAEAPAKPSEAAMTFVAAFSDSHLTSMLQRIGARQPVMMAAGQIDGEILAAVFEAEIAQAVKVHGPEWQRNLAMAWTPLLTDEEMSSLLAAGAQSPHTEKYLELRGQAGQTMQTLSQDLFTEVLTDVISRTIKQVSGLNAPPAEDASGDPAKAPAKE